MDLESSSLESMFISLDDTPIERDNFIQPAFPFPGGKYRSLENLLPHIPYSKCFVDVCGGSGGVILSRKPSKLEVYNDLHSGPTSFYRCIRDPALKDNLIERLDLIIHGREEFIWCRDTWEDEKDIIEKAARWYYMTCYSFAGLGRNFGRSLETNVTFSNKIYNKLPYFQIIHERFRNIQVENLDWRLALKDFDSHDTIFYIDPPYVNRNIYKNRWSEDDHKELCNRIMNLKGYVILSGYDNPIYNSYDWAYTKQWIVHVSATTKALNTDTSNVTEVGKTHEVEKIWVKGD